jgi:hypothetical protein
MHKGLIVGVLVFIVLIMSFVLKAKKSDMVAIPSENTATTSDPQVWACNADAKLCPDGSSVGRTGPRCEFQACPSPDATFARIETYLGGRDGGLNLTLNPREVISDSRCPKDVECIWAGTVQVRVAVETKVAHGELIFTLGEPQTVGDLTVTLVEVRPSSQNELTPENSYWFVFEAKKK